MIKILFLCKFFLAHFLVREVARFLVRDYNVCVILNISPRTLQTLRDSGKLAYTQINRKMYYKPEDVEKVINSLK